MRLRFAYMTAAGEMGGDAGQGGPSGEESGSGSGSPALGQLSDLAGEGNEQEKPNEGQVETSPEWVRDFGDADVKAWVGKKGWSGPEDALRSHMELEKFRGVPADQLIKLAPVDDKESWHGEKGVYARLGRPPSPDKYELGEVKLGNQDVTDKVRQVAFETGMSQAQAERFTKELTGWQGEAEKQRELEFVQRQQQEMEKLKVEWEANGGARANYLKATAGADMLEFDIQSEEGERKMKTLERELGTYTVMNMLRAVGELKADHKAGDPAGEFDPGTSAFAMSPERAMREIQEFEQANPELANAWARGEAPPEVNKRMDVLHSLAYPGTQR